jgi:hypothetical protein
MENLTQKVAGFCTLRACQGEPLPEQTSDKTSYNGLRKVEDKEYTGPTSIRYWM